MKKKLKLSEINVAILFFIVYNKRYLANSRRSSVVELLICNQWVGSSSLSVGTIFYLKFNELPRLALSFPDFSTYFQPLKHLPVHINESPLEMTSGFNVSHF